MADLGEDPYGRHLSYSEHLLFPTEAVAKEITSANTSSKKEEEKLKKEGKTFQGASSSHVFGARLDYVSRIPLECDFRIRIVADVMIYSPAARRWTRQGRPLQALHRLLLSRHR